MSHAASRFRILTGAIRRWLGRFVLRFEWKVQDAWIGAFWKTVKCKTDDGMKPMATDIWICLLPCIPLHITYRHKLVIPFSQNTSIGHPEK